MNFFVWTLMLRATECVDFESFGMMCFVGILVRTRYNNVTRKQSGFTRDCLCVHVISEVADATIEIVQQ